MKKIKVINPKDDSISQQLVGFYLTFKNITRNEKVIFDLSDLNWLFPLIVLPISAYIHKTKSQFIPSKNLNVNSYLKTICFPEGVDSIAGFKKYLSYIPIGVLKKTPFPHEKEKVESCFVEMIYKILKPTAAAKNAIFYPITELITNIFEHSKSNDGYVFAQYYSKKEFLDLCIVDCGRGLAASYNEENHLKLTDKEAIRCVLAGRSTKSDIERGYGIRTSKRVVCEGLNSNFILLSGENALYSIKNKEKIISLPKFYWQGVVVCYRIPRPHKSINIMPFIEG